MFWVGHSPQVMLASIPLRKCSQHIQHSERKGEGRDHTGWDQVTPKTHWPVAGMDVWMEDSGVESEHRPLPRKPTNNTVMRNIHICHVTKVKCDLPIWYVHSESKHSISVRPWVCEQYAMPLWRGGGWCMKKEQKREDNIIAMAASTHYDSSLASLGEWGRSPLEEDCSSLENYGHIPLPHPPSEVVFP